MAEPLPAFVARRRSDWEQLERLLDAHRRRELRLADLEVLDRLYRRAAADLARAQAFYPATDAHRFLNQLCGSAYGAIYRAPANRLAALKELYARGFPRTVRREARFIAASALLMALGGILGAGVVWFEPRGAELLVAPALREAVAARQLWTDSLLSVTPPGVVSSAILTNNLTVAITLFALGATFGLGTALVLLFNGIHLGAVSALCLREELGGPLFTFIAAHGPVELSIIAIAGGAGLMVGHALIDPGELPRSAFVKRRAAAAVTLLVGCAPFLALIGVVEGYVSPGDLFPAGVKVALGLALGAAFWGYLLLGARAD